MHKSQNDKECKQSSLTSKQTTSHNDNVQDISSSNNFLLDCTNYENQTATFLAPFLYLYLMYIYTTYFVYISHIIYFAYKYIVHIYCIHVI